MGKAEFILVLLLVIIRNGQAQTGFTIYGTVQDSAGIALSHATVRLGMEKDTLSVLTKEDGHFFFSIEPIRTFELRVTMKGYLPYKKRFTVAERGSSLQLKPVILQTDYHELEPVTVARVRPLTIGDDTLTYHAAAFSVREGAEAEALLKRLPGIEVDQDGNLIVQGKKIDRVMVDGKVFFGGDVLTATRNLPADIIDRIQVIDDYGDKARLTGVKSGESVKVLNLILKQDKRNGKFGHANAGYGNRDKYTTAIFANSFAGERQISLYGGLENNNPAGNTYAKRIGISYADRWNQKWKQEGNLTVSGEDPSSNANTVQDIFFAGGQIHQVQRTETISSTRSANLGSTVTYTPNAFHKLRISPYMRYQQSRQSVGTDFSTMQQESGFAKLTTGSLLNQTDSKSYSGGAELYFEQLSPYSKKRFNTQLSVQFSDNKQVNDNRLHSLIQTDTQRSLSQQDYLIKSNGPSQNLEVQMNYFTPLGKTGFLELGYSWYSAQTCNSKTTQGQDSMQRDPVTIDSLSQEYAFRSMNQRLHTGYSAYFKQFHLSFGLDLQPGYFSGNTSSKGSIMTYHYFNVLPVMQLSYAFSRTRTLSFQYSGNPQLPGLQQVQPLTDLTNPQYPVTGNPSLRAGFTQGVSLHYEQSFIKPTQFQGFGVSMGFTTTRDAIIQNIIHPKDSSAVIQRTSYLNANGFHSLYANYHLSLPAILHKRLRITLNGSMTRSNSISMTDNVLYPTISLNAGQGVHFQFLIPEIIESDLSGNYNYSSTRYPAGNGSAISFATAGWSMRNRHYFLRHGVLSYQVSQAFTNRIGLHLQSNPAIVTASLQWQFLARNRATISLTGYDLSNGATGINQSISLYSVVKSQITLVGRYFMITFLFKWGKFKE